ncbi:MAG: TlpA family protein disulfide reductase [Flavisolibacter sp.]
MMFLRTFIIVYFIWINVLHSQPGYDFNLTIRNSNADIGTLQMGEAYYSSQYKACLFEVDSSSCFKGAYKFNNKILYPTAIRVFNLNGFNQLLFIDTGLNEAEIVVKDSILQFQANAKIEREHKFFLEQMGINNIGEQIPIKKFQAYVERNPKSYIALFALIDQMFNYRFSPEMRDIADHLDTTIRATKAFSYFRDQYLDRKKFIAMNVINAKEKAVTLNFDSRKYTLLDFWWVGCKGCYADMKKLNQKSNSLKNQLNIISINTDSRTEFKRSRLRFFQQKLSWKSYWDYDGVMSQKNIFFYKYPTNLLIDKNGYIVATDINIDRLEDFIKD